MRLFLVTELDREHGYEIVDINNVIFNTRAAAQRYIRSRGDPRGIKFTIHEVDLKR